jgi:hypothetical protein
VAAESEVVLIERAVAADPEIVTVKFAAALDDGELESDT